VQRGERAEEIDIAFRREDQATGGRVAREIRVNGVSTRRPELFGHLLSVLAGPNDMEVVSGGPHLRRRLLDLLLAQTSASYYYTILRYARTVLQRNRLLRTRSVQGLDAWDEQIAALGAAITVRRRHMVARLGAFGTPIYDALSLGREPLDLQYVPSLRGSDEPDLASFARESLARRRQEELVRGMTLVGPHRDDLSVVAGGRDLRTYGSRGQQLTALLALRLAERRVLWEETGEEPVMLFDDVLLILDEERQAYLMDCMRGVQAIMTLTTLAVVAARPADATIYSVQAGVVVPEHAHLS
ncbi:MAG: DNA replication/repair protein RecF, partial [bacterium]